MGFFRQPGILKNRPSYPIGDDYKLDPAQVKNILERKKQKGRGKQIKGRSDGKKRNANELMWNQTLHFQPLFPF